MTKKLKNGDEVYLYGNSDCCHDKNKKIQNSQKVVAYMSVMAEDPNPCTIWDSGIVQNFARSVA